MTTWAERAKSCFSQERQGGAPINPETTVLGVLGVVPLEVQEKERDVLGVLGVAPCPILENAHPADERLLGMLLPAAMRACDRHGDGEDARAQMRADCLATPPHLRADLLAHFAATYPKARP